MLFDCRVANAVGIRRLVLAVAMSLQGACGDGGGNGVEYFAPGGVSEEMRTARGDARLNLDHTVVTLLEATDVDASDTGSEPGVDEFAYHFDQPTEVRLSNGDFDEAPMLSVLDATGMEIGYLGPGSTETRVTVHGEHTFRFIHPRAGDPEAEPILFFFQPILPETTVSEEPGAALAGADPDDVATLKADKSCFRCNLAGLSWNACPGVSLSGLNLGHADFSKAVIACQTFESSGDTPTLLSGANFSGASLSQVTLKDVDLTDAIFAGASFDVTTFDSVTATAADFSDSEFSNSTFGAPQSSGSSARSANFNGAQIIRNSCLSAQDLRGADFTNALFDSTSSVNSTWFAGANLFNVTFDGTRFKHDSILPDCGRPTSCSTVTVSGLCENCPCNADVGCLVLDGAAACPENQGPVSLAENAVCQRATVQAAAEGVTVQNTDLTSVAFNGADLTNSTFASNSMDSTSDFSGTILDGVDFTGQDLGKAVDLSGAYLSDSTDFTGAVLTDAPATQRGVILSCVTAAGTGGCDFAQGTEQFKGADMQYARLTDVGLSAADLEGVVLDNASMVGINLNLASLKGASLKGATLGTSQGAGGAASLRGAFMINVDLTDTDLRSVDFTGAHVYGAESDALFVRAKLDSADFTDAILTGGVFTNASLTGAAFNGAQLMNASFEGAALNNAKFDDAYLQGADFSTAASVTGMSLSNSAVSTELTSTMCTLVAAGTWTYTEQDGTPYTFMYGTTKLQTDASVTCPDNIRGPCNTGDSLCPVSSGPFPPVPPCVPVYDYCYENCLSPPCFLDTPDPICPLVSNCS